MLVSHQLVSLKNHVLWFDKKLPDLELQFIFAQLENMLQVKKFSQVSILASVQYK